MEERSYRTFQYDTGETVHELPVLAEILSHDDPIHDHYEVDYRPRPRRVLLPVMLFIVTCLSTFLAGIALENKILDGNAGLLLQHPGLIPSAIAGYWRDGLAYMVAVMSILFAHEMGHFLQAVRYRVPASLPFFIPMPFSPIGTMGAVIGMQGSQANRKELFDIGLSGPLAGLVLAIPITVIGILYAHPVLAASPGEIMFGAPLIMSWMVPWLRPDIPIGAALDDSPLLLAGWVGMLITGLNMLPISQLDGGHVAYALFGRGAHVLARFVLLGAIAFIVLAGAYNWLVMLLLVMAIGIDHPPTHNDHTPIGWWRYALGLASLTISIFCLAPIPISMGP